MDGAAEQVRSIGILRVICIRRSVGCIFLSPSLSSAQPKFIVFLTIAILILIYNPLP